jgi:4-nitrophenyl phosphatase
MRSSPTQASQHSEAPSADPVEALRASPVHRALQVREFRTARASNLDGVDLLEQASGYVIDLDGTLRSGNLVLPGAQALLDYARDRYVVVSNNSRDTATTLAAELDRLGLKVDSERIVLAGEQAVLEIARCYPAARVRIVASRTLAHLATRRGCNVVEEEPDVILLGRDQTFDYKKLASIVNQIRRGARLVAANPDMTHPAADGGVWPETGSLLSAVLACTETQVDAIVGKPEPLLFAEALRRLGTTAESTLVIGDNPLTDAAGASRLGMRFLLVGRHAGAHIASLDALF